MNLILNNPYRIIGLLVGATAREQDRQIKRLRQLIDADQKPDEGFSFPTIGKFNRTIESVNDSAAKLNLNIDKMNAALFWFYIGNPITDEPAFDSLKEGAEQIATEIWTKLTLAGEVTKRSSSAYQNLSTMLLCKTFNDDEVNATLLEQSIILKLKFLESDFLIELKSLAADATFITTKKELQLYFLNQIQSELRLRESINSNNFLEIINKQDFSAKEDFLEEFAQSAIELIEKRIASTKAKRKGNNLVALNEGNILFEQIGESLAQLNSILGSSNNKLVSITDKISYEVLQCGIEYFLFYRDSSNDPSSGSMDLFRKAQSLAVGNIAIQRCQENIINLQEWINNKPNRENQIKVKNDLQILKSLIDEFNEKANNIVNAQQLLTKAEPYLTNIRSVLGSKDNLYLGLSTSIASNSQRMCVAEINKLQERFKNTFDQSTKRATISLLKEKVVDAIFIAGLIKNMDLNHDFRSHFELNNDSLIKLKIQFDNINTGPTRKACYIATMAYGDYNHPQVLILRQFRDEILEKTEFGKSIISIYYNYSPKLVKKLKNKISINYIIRVILDLFIVFIKKLYKSMGNQLK